MSNVTYYDILEISEKASQEVIRMAYKALCKKYHPDIYQGDKNFAEEQMKKINAAYETLSDEIKKGKYDHYLNSQKHYDSTHYEYKRESTQINIEALLKRGFMSLEERRFAEALNFFEQVLNQNAEVAEAYLGKLCVDLKVRFPYELSNVTYSFNDNSNFKKAMRFGDEKLKSNLQGYIDAIIQKQLSDAYNNALYTMRNATGEDDFRLAAKKFSAISHYKDSSNLAKTCLKKAEIAHKEQKYIDACNIMSTSTTINSYQKAIAVFESINDWNDSKEKILYCKKKIGDIKVILEEERIAKEKAEKERKEQERLLREQREKAKKRKTKIVHLILTSFALLLLCSFVIETTGLISYVRYNYALHALEKGDYEKSYVTFRELQKYKNSETYLSKFEVTYEKKVEIDSYGNETIVERNGKTVLADDIAVATEKGLQNAGKTITETHSSNGTDYINTYTYSKSGLLKKHVTKSDTYSRVMHEITRTQKFDKNDNLIKSTEKNVEIIDGDGDTSYKVTNTYKYNKYGDLIKKIEKCTGSDSQTTEYKYDKYGNKTMEHPLDLSYTYKKTWKYYGIKVSYKQ